MLSSVTELHAYIDPGQLTTDLGGTQEYCHDSWISHRTVCTHTCLHFKCICYYYFSFLMLMLPSAGDRGFRPHGEDHGSDPAGIRHGARRDGVAQRCRGHHQPAAHTHSEEGENEGQICFFFFFLLMLIIYMLVQRDIIPCVCRKTLRSMVAKQKCLFL